MNLSVFLWDALQHAADTVRVHDTITVHDTVRVTVRGSGFDWLTPLKYILGSGFVVTIGLQLLKSRSKRREADRRASLEAFAVRRQLRAAFEKHLTEPPKTDDLIGWAHHASAGFDAVTSGFEKLKQIAPEASGAIAKAITEAYAGFSKGSGTINRVLAEGRRTGSYSGTTDSTLRPSYRELRAAITSLERAISKDLRDHEDGYHAP